MSNDDPTLTTEFFEQGRITVRNQVLGLNPFLSVEILDGELKLTLAGVEPENANDFVAAIREVLSSVNVEFAYVDEDPGVPAVQRLPIADYDDTDH